MEIPQKQIFVLNIPQNVEVPQNECGSSTDFGGINGGIISNFCSQSLILVLIFQFHLADCWIYLLLMIFGRLLLNIFIENENESSIFCEY